MLINSAWINEPRLTFSYSIFFSRVFSLYQSDSKYAFISVEGVGGEPGTVDIINLETLNLISSVNTGKQAGGIAFWKISH